MDFSDYYFQSKNFYQWIYISIKRGYRYHAQGFGDEGVYGIYCN